jgi:hypothetical protein
MRDITSVAAGMHEDPLAPHRGAASVGVDLLTSLE